MASTPLSTADKITRRKRLIRSFEKKALLNRTFAERISDVITSSIGSMSFLLVNCYLFFAWLVINSDILPGIHPFDPFPFGLLTMIMSIEAIILSIFVLISQNRSAKIEALRDELHLQVNLIAEEEVTKSLELLAEIRAKLGIKKEDKELDRMLERIDTSYIERSLQKQMESSSIDHISFTNPISAIPEISLPDISIPKPNGDSQKKS